MSVSTKQPAKPRRTRSNGPRMMVVMGELREPMTVSTVRDGDTVRVVVGERPDAVATVTEVPDQNGLNFAARCATARALGVGYDEAEVVGLCGTTHYGAEGTSASLPDQIAAFVNGWRLALGTEGTPPAAEVARGIGFSEAVVEHVLREMTARGW